MLIFRATLYEHSVTDFWWSQRDILRVDMLSKKNEERSAATRPIDCFPTCSGLAGVQNCYQSSIKTAVVHRPIRSRLRSSDVFCIEDLNHSDAVMNTLAG